MTLKRQVNALNLAHDKQPAKKKPTLNAIINICILSFSIGDDQ